jgi:hypothetical protein
MSKVELSGRMWRDRWGEDDTKEMEYGRNISFQ